MSLAPCYLRSSNIYLYDNLANGPFMPRAEAGKLLVIRTNQNSDLVFNQKSGFIHSVIKHQEHPGVSNKAGMFGGI